MDYQFGPFRIDVTKRRVWRGDELIALTPKAFETLIVLVARAGEVVDKDELLEAAWSAPTLETARVECCRSAPARIPDGYPRMATGSPTFSTVQIPKWAFAPWHLRAPCTGSRRTRSAIPGGEAMAVSCSICRGMSH